MALFQIDEQQFEGLKSEIAALSNNLAKWQAAQTAVIQTGFASLIAALTGADINEVQQRINTLAETVKTEADALEQAATKSEGE